MRIAKSLTLAFALLLTTVVVASAEETKAPPARPGGAAPPSPGAPARIPRPPADMTAHRACKKECGVRAREAMKACVHEGGKKAECKKNAAETRRECVKACKTV